MEIKEREYPKWKDNLDKQRKDSQEQNDVFPVSNEELFAGRTRFVFICEIHNLHTNATTLCFGATSIWWHNGWIDDVSGVWGETRIFFRDDSQRESSEKDQVDNIQKKFGVVEITPQAPPFVT